MRVLYFHQYFNTPRGAGGIRSYEFARRLIARGHQVTMVCVIDDTDPLDLPGPPGALIHRGVIDGIDVIQFRLTYSNYQSLPQRARIFMRYALRGIGLALKLDYDIVFATSTPLTAGIPGIFARYLRSKPFVFEVRDLWPELPKAMGVVTNPLVLSALSALEWVSYRAASACIGLSPGIGQGIVRRSRKRLPIAVIPNAADLDLFHPGKREDLRLDGIGPKDFVAVFTGAHGLANGLDAVLDAAAELKLRGRNDIKLVFIGEGKLKPKLVERAQHEGLDNCRFFGLMPKQKLNEIISCADAGLMILANIPAFYYGTSPNKFFDYISAGLPVINNYPGWLADMILQHRCGLAVPPGNPAAFADALCRLADHPELRREFSANSRHLAETKFSRSLMADKFVDWLEAARLNRAPAGLQPFE
ncbi:MAG TPA: glycosyltransferase family 4 protein [Opitutales bacterium]|jgi:glycosyltransferase involved in cell wall biosynthesis|nr:glycosyltransferase family 4 protein [Opitutales bacterium]